MKMLRPCSFRLFSARLVLFAGLTSPVFTAATAATYTVINTNDTGAGSLRAAITSVLTSTPPNEIHFNIPGPGPHTIKVGNSLPFITNSVSILGDTQPGYTGTPVVTILGPTTDFFDYGLTLQGPNSLVRGLRLTGFTKVDFGAGITLNASLSSMQVAACVLDGNFNGIIAQGGVVGGTTTNDRNIIINNVNGIWMVTGSTAAVRGNFIGVQADGVTPAGNENGIRTFYTSGRTIEGHPNYPQVISGNNVGILLGPNGGYVFFSSANTIRGNYIGTDITGMLAVSNNIGIWSLGGAANIIGGTSTNHRNIISGNGETGVLIEGLVFGVDISSYNNQVIGNYIGLAADGVTPLKNNVGVHILNGRENVIGGTSTGQSNRFGAADFYNVYISSTPSLACYSNRVIGNSISITEGQTGIFINDASNNVIGGATSTARNVIGGAGTGIYITGPRAQGNRVIGNTIGCGPAGELFPNDSYGINIFNAARNIIGGAYTNEANTISGNQFYGVLVQGTGSFNNTISGNRIGTDPTGTISLSNRYTGVNIAGGAFSNLVGGADYSRANVIAGNGGAAVRLADPNTYGNQVSYNFIGMNTNYLAISNSQYGVEIFNASSNLIGGANIIGNSQSPYPGIRIGGTNAYGNIVYGNIVGMDPAGNTHPNYGGIDVADARDTIVGFSLFTANQVSGNFSDGIIVRGLASNTQVRFNLVGGGPTGTNRVPNTGNGVYVDAPHTIVGGIGSGNIISGNGGDGVFVGSNGTNAIVQGNYIGPDISGSVALTNGGSGVRVDASGVLVGGTNVAARNLISGNNLYGVEIQSGARDVVVQGNYLGLNVSGSLAISNRQYGVLINNATNIVIGGTGTARNVISASRLSGIGINGSSSNILVVGNYIGLNASATAAIPNGVGGVEVNASDVTIGGTGDLGNVLSGNNAYGLDVTTGRNVRVLGNTIGLAANGATPIPNTTGGVRLRGGAQGVLFGGTNTSDANVIARNGSTSELTVDGPSSGHHIIGNFIGVQRFGLTFTNNDTGRGLFINNSSSNRIVGNILGQNGEALYLLGTGSFANVIQGNFIGEYNLEPVTNSSWGVTITNARNNVLGGFTAEERNLIAHNNGGILVTGTNAINNLLVPNLIFSNSARLSIDLGTVGFNTNDNLDADLGPNRLQNRPVLTNQIVAGPFVYVQGVLTSAPLTTFALDLFRSGSTNAHAFRYIGRSFIDTDGSGVAHFTAGFLFSPPAGSFLTATVTDPDNNTSEMAASPTGVIATAVTDGDNDTIADWWEILYGLNPAVSNAPDADLDTDGFTDREEYIADTAANNADAFPIITWIASETNRLVTLPSSSARVYSLQTTESLTTGAWTQVGSSVTGQLGWTTLVDTNLTDGNAYRFGVRLP
jgi:hypothetical protein